MGRKTKGTLLDTVTGLKKCNCCEQYKPGSEFSKDKTRKDGLNNKCKECDRISTKQYDQEHKEERLQYQQQYYQEHKEAKQQYMQQYNQEHKEEKRQYDKQRNEAIKNGTHIVKPRKTQEQAI